MTALGAGLPETVDGNRASAARSPWRSGGLAREKTAPLPVSRFPVAVSVSSSGPVAQPGAPPGPATAWEERLTVAIVLAAGEPALTGTRSIEWPRTPPLWLSWFT